MNFFASIYILIIVPSIFFLVGAIKNLYKKAFSQILVVLVLPLYLLGTYRSSGIDVQNYRNIFEASSNDMFDPGYLALINISKFSGFSFEIFLFSLGVLSSLFYFRISKYFSVRYGILLLILMVHIFIVRDYSQLRIGLAVAIVLFSYTYSGKFKYIGYFFGASIHLTSVVLIGLVIYYELILKNRLTFFRLIFPLLIIFLAGYFINYLGMVDPRIELYLNWDRAGYGAKATDFKQPLFIVFIIMFHIYFFRKSLYEIDLFTFTYLASLIIFFSFSDFAIFSSRLSNVAMSLYPITIASMYESTRPNFNKAFGILLFLLLVGLRNNSFEIINSIQIG
ncbi:MAG: hypothetical protein CMD72_04435 [Gammaproteobacteria bacterium]|nr:hypothetical protein [Gammaproteobacteria bacterium]